MGKLAFRHFGVPPAKVVEWFGINKATLLRWERRGLLSQVPQTSRGLQTARKYGQSELAALYRLKCDSAGELLVRLAKSALTQDKETERALRESLGWYRLLSGDMEGLRELKQLPTLSSNTHKRLIRLLYEFYQPDDEVFYEVLMVVDGHLHKCDPVGT